MNAKGSSSVGATLIMLLGILLMAIGINEIIHLQPSLQEANGFLYRTTSGLEGLFGGNSMASHAENLRQQYFGFIVMIVIGALMSLVGVIRLAIGSR